MSKLRPTLHTTTNRCTAEGATAYYVVYNAVKYQQHGLIHGRLNDAHGDHCAIGSYFAIAPQATLRESFIDEVATVNDSVPRATMKQRRLVVLRWLRWKLGELGMPGFRRSAAAVAPVVPAKLAATKTVVAAPSASVQ